MKMSMCMMCVLAVCTATLSYSQAAAGTNTHHGILLEDLTWQAAERVLTPDRVVVIAVGAEAKEHGPHLRLNNDWLMAEYFKRRVLDAADVVVAPTINYSYYPAFLEYPGSTTLRLDTARDMVVDVIRSLAHYGPARFYILNTGLSTNAPLKQAQDLLAKDGIVMRFTDITKFDEIEKPVRTSAGAHGDEIETSMMLYIAPESVDMKKAVRDQHENKGPLTRSETRQGTYSPSGIFGDPTRATRAKGQIVVEGMTAAILREIEELRKLPAQPDAVVHDYFFVLTGRREITLSPAILARYVGTYELRQSLDLVVTLEGNQLQTQMTGQPKLALFAESETKFFLKALDAQMEFFTNEKGEVTHLVLHYGGKDGKGVKK